MTRAWRKLPHQSDFRAFCQCLHAERLVERGLVWLVRAFTHHPLDLQQVYFRPEKFLTSVNWNERVKRAEEKIRPRQGGHVKLSRHLYLPDLTSSTKPAFPIVALPSFHIRTICLGTEPFSQKCPHQLADIRGLLHLSLLLPSSIPFQ